MLRKAFGFKKLKVTGQRRNQDHQRFLASPDITVLNVKEDDMDGEYISTSVMEEKCVYNFSTKR
jgi:hypothetical protein